MYLQDDSEFEEEVIEGGKTDNEPKSETKFEVIDNISQPKMEIFKPVYTRPILSKNEYVGALTTMAKYIDDLDSLEDYIEDGIEIHNLGNSAAIVFSLFKAGKLDCLIIRNHGREKITMSQLKINPRWIEQLDKYFKKWKKSVDKELFQQISQILDRDE